MGFEKLFQKVLVFSLIFSLLSSLQLLLMVVIAFFSGGYQITIPQNFFGLLGAVYTIMICLISLACSGYVLYLIVGDNSER